MSQTNQLSVITETGNPVEPVSNPLDLPSEVFSSGLARRKSNRAELMRWVREALVEGVDYGKIHIVSKDKCKKGKYCTNPHHFSKPSLFKPGAEKICGMLGVTSSFPSLGDYEQAVLGGVALQQIIIRCEISDASGRVVADGVGARSVKQDYGDINKALKMAEKSAHIDATLRMAGLSEVFTQDLEDINSVTNTSQSENSQSDPVFNEPNSGESQPPAQTQEIISAKDHRQIEAIIADLGLDRERVKVWLAKATAKHPNGPVLHLNQLPQPLYQPLLDRLDQWSVAQQQQAQ